MRLTFATLTFLFAPSLSLADEPCPTGRTDIIRLESYEVSKHETSFSEGMKLEAKLKNVADRGIRMVDGYIAFQDVLGRSLIVIGIDPDMRLEPQGVATQEGLYSRDRRLLDVHKDDVVVTTCVSGLVYSDGEVMKVDE